LDRIGTPSARFANRGVHNIYLGPNAKKPELRGERIVVAIFDKKDWVVRELREEPVTNLDQVLDPATGLPSTATTCIVDCDLQGIMTVLHHDAKEVLGNARSWVTLLDNWSKKYGVPQDVPVPAPAAANAAVAVAA
jgi:hypothetical protein